MSTFYIPDEDDIRRWIKEAIEEFLNEALAKSIPPQPSGDEQLLCRKEIAGVLGISLVTLHDWMNRGLPCHKQRGRVYFIRSEVMDYVKANRRGPFVAYKNYYFALSDKFGLDGRDFWEKCPILQLCYKLF